MKLIDKDALVAEIDRLVNNYDKALDYEAALEDVRNFIDTLEVKEVDLEKVFNDEYSKFSNDVDAMDYGFPIDLADYKDFAKHFFELALSLKK